MRLKKIHLKDFRNLSDCELSLSDGTTVFYGGVGEGKTNIVESILLLSIGRSHRTTENGQMISWGKNEAYVRGEAENSTSKLTAAIKITRNGKRIELNGEQNKRSIELIGGIKSVIFHSEDISIVGGGPALRRRYLDVAISQASKNYAYNLRDYYKALKQRNTALNAFPGSNLAEWDDQLSSLGSWITQVRAQAVLEIAEMAKKIAGSLIGVEGNFNISYSPGGEDTPETFKVRLAKARPVDNVRGITTVGPHRDDIKIILDGVDARYFASSGEKKTIALALKLAEVEFIQSMTGEKPIVLLDDVFSTLDQKRSRALLSVTGDGSQCIITTTDLNYLIDEIREGVSLYEVSNGQTRKA